MNRAKHEKPLELIEILKENFLQDETGKWYVPDHNKASDLEKVRQRSLLKEFNEYPQRAPAPVPHRSGACWLCRLFQAPGLRYHHQIAERLPEDVLREDPDLLMYYDSALLEEEINPQEGGLACSHGTNSCEIDISMVRL